MRICKGEINLLKWKLPHCPHCGEKVDFLTAWVEKTEGEFKCRYCGKASDIKFKDNINKVSITCEIIAVVIVLLFMLLSNEFTLYGSFLVLLPFIYFYIRVPYMMELEIIKRRIVRKSSGQSNIMKNNVGRDNVRQRINRVNDMPIDRNKK